MDRLQARSAPFVRSAALTVRSQVQPPGRRPLVMFPFWRISPICQICSPFRARALGLAFRIVLPWHLSTARERRMILQCPIRRTCILVILASSVPAGAVLSDALVPSLTWMKSSRRLCAVLAMLALAWASDLVLQGVFPLEMDLLLQSQAGRGLVVMCTCRLHQALGEEATERAVVPPTAQRPSRTMHSSPLGQGPMGPGRRPRASILPPLSRAL